MRNALIILASLCAGLLVGVLIAGVFLAVSLHIDVNSMDMFLFLDYLPNSYRWGRSPYQEAYWIVALFPVLALIIAIFALTRAKLSTYEDAHFQTKAELKRNEMLEPMGAGLLLGRQITPPKLPKDKPLVIAQDHNSWKRYLPASIMGRVEAYQRANPGPFISADYDKFPNVLVVAPPGAGKTVGYVIPTTITSPDSLVILDVKGEIFEKTSRLRKSYGNKVYRFAPFDFENPSHQYNPLHRIAQYEDQERQFTELQKISHLFLQVDGTNSQDFVGGGAEIFTAAGMLAIERQNPTFGEIYRIIYGEGGKVGDVGVSASDRLLDAAREVDYPQARQILVEYSGMEAKIRDSYLSVLKSAGLRQWANPRVERLTRRNEIDFTTLRKERQSIYLCVASDDIPALDSLIRLFFSELIRFLRHNEPGEDEPLTVQIMLDEFFQLGHMPIVVKALLQLRSHGGRISLIVQSVLGLSDIYTQGEVDIIKAGALKLYITANENDTAKEIEELLGTRTGVDVTRSKDIDAVGPNAGSVSFRSEEIPLLSAQQIKRLDNTKVIILPEQQYPILAERISYFTDPELAPWYDGQAGEWPYPSEVKAYANDQKDEERLQKARRMRAAKKAVEANAPVLSGRDADSVDGPYQGREERGGDHGEDSAPAPQGPKTPKGGNGGEAAPDEGSKVGVQDVWGNMEGRAEQADTPELSDEAKEKAATLTGSAVALGSEQKEPEA